MRALYRKYVKYKENRIVRLHYWKTYIFEWLAIWRKRRLYKHIKWTREQTRDFNDFWVKHYGKKISNRWHKLYQSFNGNFDVQYFPEILYTTRLELKLNPFIACNVLADKSLTELLFSGSLANGVNSGVRIPKTFGLRSGRYYYDENRNITSREDLLERLSNIGPAVVKPTVGGSSGYNVRIIDLQNGKDAKSQHSLSELLKEYGSHWIIQEKLKQCSAVAALYNDSINTIRITTYICDSHVYHVPLALRMGTGGGNIDNVHAGGIGIGVREDGTLNKYAYRLGFGDTNETFVKHPDSGVVFDGYQIPNMDKVIQAAYKLHGRTPGIGIISWDIILDQDEEPVVIEANYIAQGLWFPQIINKSSLFGENTVKMIEFVRNAQK